MSISTYAELQSAVANWLARSDLTSRIPEFIALCEAKLNREIRAVDQDTKNTSFSINAEYVNVPSGFLQAKSFEASLGGRRYSLKLMPDEMQTDRYNDTGAPIFYSVVGSQFRFAPAPDATYTATLVYYTSIVGLATTSPNWVLTKHPDVYLYGSLLEAEGFIQDDARLAVWKRGYDEGIAGIRGSNNRNRWGCPGLAARPG